MWRLGVSQCDSFGPHALSSSQHPGLWPKVEASYGGDEGVPPTLGNKAD